MSLLKNSDLGDNGVPLYFHIEDKIFDDALPVFKEFGIPESWCRKITAPVSETEPELKVNKTQFGKTYLGLLDDEIDTDILMLLDSDFFTCVLRTKNLSSIRYSRIRFLSVSLR